MPSNELTDTRATIQALREAIRLGDDRRVEALDRDLVSRSSQDPEGLELLAIWYRRHGDVAAAIDRLCLAVCTAPLELRPALALGETLETTGFGQGARLLSECVTRQPDAIYAWLMLGRVREAKGESLPALQAYHQAVLRAHRHGRWFDETSTPAEVLDAVRRAIHVVRTRRKDLFMDAYASVREQFGGADLRRVDHALSNYLRELSDTPPSIHQRPRFFYFPGLPPGPFHDPHLHPWTVRLADSWQTVRDEACQALEADHGFPSFFNLKPGTRIESYLRSDRGKPAWDALFFYRRGARFDRTHDRCPQTSRLLESIELCSIAEESPEICFSVLAPHTEILPHYGVTNVRLVMHLPLVVPPNCALDVRGGGEHHWKEGEPLLFDDTYQHSAWNRSDRQRVILLMDCWNPHLSSVERLAVRQLIEAISGLARAARAGRETPQQ